MSFELDFLKDVGEYVEYAQITGGTSGFGLETIPVSVRVRGEAIPDADVGPIVDSPFNDRLSLRALVTGSAEVLASSDSERQIKVGPIETAEDRYITVLDQPTSTDVTLVWDGPGSFERTVSVDRTEFAVEILKTGEEFVNFIEDDLIPYCEGDIDTLVVPMVDHELKEIKAAISPLAAELGRQPAWEGD